MARALVSIISTHVALKLHFSSPFGRIINVLRILAYRRLDLQHPAKDSSVRQQVLTVHVNTVKI
jgi:hypothetical protein